MSDSAYGGLSDKSCKQCDISNGLFDRFAEMQKKHMLTDIILTSSDGKRLQKNQVALNLIFLLDFPIVEKYLCYHNL